MAFGARPVSRTRKRTAHSRTQAMVTAAYSHIPTRAPTPQTTPPPAPQATPAVPGSDPAALLALTPDQALQYGSSEIDLQQQLADLDAADKEAAAKTALEQTQIEKQRAQQAESATDALIARGLFRSSIREHDLNDIDTAAAQRATELTTALAALTAAHA